MERRMGWPPPGLLLVLPAVFAIMMMGKAKKSSSLDPDDPESTHYDKQQTQPA